MATQLILGLMCLVAVVIVAYGAMVSQRVERYEDFRDTFGMTQYNMYPQDFNIFLINMDSKTDRLENFIQSYKKTDFYNVKSVERVRAVVGTELDLSKYVSDSGKTDIEMIEKRGYRIKHNQLTRGAVGCYLSHMNTYQMIRDRPEPYGIIFEDDIEFNVHNVYSKMRIAMAKIPDDWDMLLLGCVCHVCKTHSEGYRDLDHFFLLHAYVVKKTGAEKILQNLEFMPIRQQIDSELSAMATDGKLKVYCLSSPIVWQDSRINKTSIQTPLKVIQGVNPYSLIM